MKGLTPRQASVLGVIAGHVIGTGYPPTIRELMDGINVRNICGATNHLEALERKGFITRSTSPRGIRVLRDANGNEVTLTFRKVSP